MQLSPEIPARLTEYGGASLQWETLRERLAAGALSPLGHSRILALSPSADLGWINQQQSRSAEMQLRIESTGLFEFRGLIDVTELLERARIDGSALEPLELRALIGHAERIEAWRQAVLAPPESVREQWPAIVELSAPLLGHDLGGLLRALVGKIEPDGSLSDDASPQLRQIRRAMEQQHRSIQASLRHALARLSDDGSSQEALITVRGERFVIPVKAEFKRKIGGVIHGSSSSGQTVFVEPLETIEQNNELTRLMDEEQAEIHRILVAMTRAVAAEATALTFGAAVLAEADAHQALARFALELQCVRPSFVGDTRPSVQQDERFRGVAGILTDDDVPSAAFELDLQDARHPLLELRLRSEQAAITPLTITLPAGTRQMIVSGPNTGGKTVALKTTGLLAVMAQSGLPVPASRAHLPVFTAIFADIGDAQSIEQNLSTFSAHIVNVQRIAQMADLHSLVLLDELGSATDPEEGAALAVAVASHFLTRRAWCFITTHLTSLKVYAAQHADIVNAAVGFDEATLSPTYELRLGVPGASAGLNIAARLGLDPAIVAAARAQQTTQQVDIGRFLDELHAQLSAASTERSELAAQQRELTRQRERLEQEGRAEQQVRTRELERQLRTLIESFESQLKDTVKAIEDKTVAQKIARDSALRIAQLKREFSAQFHSTIAAHNSAGDPAGHRDDAPSRRKPRVGDTVRLNSLNREGRILRLVDERTLEIAVGAMKTRVPITDVAEITAYAEAPKARRGGVSVQSFGDSDSIAGEINVIGRTADEAETEVARFVEHAFLAGLPRIRVVHGVGMGVLRRTLRTLLRNHPHVATISEPAYNEGGQGVTLVELRS